ncbi:MAG: hypothetical protein D3923_18695, partial [Candidatus Electrothrix sp. AR3]|nr:hypothetical protein [Candidatus Electrothrix sp. AR3]
VWGGVAGHAYTVVVKCDGSLWAWGGNNNGKLDNKTKSIPVRIGADNDWQTVSAGYDYAVALKKDGSLWIWSGQSNTIPVRVNMANDWQAVASGNKHIVALKKDSSLWAWGSNAYGQLGDGTKVSKSSPVQIGYATDWQAVSAGQNHTVALKSDGSSRTWGENWYSEFGVKTTEQKNRPKQLTPDTDWQTIAVGDYHTVALKMDGSLWAWGSNEYGQLGDGTAWQERHVLIISSDDPCTWIVTPSAGSGGNISLYSPQTVNHGGMASFTIIPDPGYSLDKAEGCGGILNGNTYTTAPVIADCTVTASFKLNVYTVTPLTDVSGSISPDTPLTINHDKTASFTVTPDASYRLDKVEGCSGTRSGNTYTTDAITADCTV